jgi:hypothetical protein
MPESESSREEFLNLLAEMGEEPAFVQRARAPQAALESLHAACVVRRAELLEWPRRHFATLRRRVGGDWKRLGRYLRDPDSYSVFAELERQLPDVESDVLVFLVTERGALRQFVESVDRFNRAWLYYVEHAGLEDVNRLRDEYNRFYPVEKACAFGSESINRNFEALPPIRMSDLLDRFPPLVLPQLA